MASQHGADGDLVAPRVADALGVPFLDRDLPADPEQPEQRPPAVLGRLSRASSVLASAPLERLDQETGAVRTELMTFLAQAASTGGVVLGRGAAVAVADAPAALHVLLTGPTEGRVRRIAGRDHVSREEAERRVRRHDRARRRYVQVAFGQDPDDRALYHLIVDAVALGADAAVDLVVTASRARLQRAPQAER